MTDRISDEELLREVERIEACGWHPDHSQNQIARALRELSALRTREAGWQTMDTAPVEFDIDYRGLDALLWSSDYGIHRGAIWRGANGDIRAQVSGFHGVKWTHWMPLPAPPALSQPTGEGSA